MITQTDFISRLLERDVLGPAEDIQRADWRVQIFGAEQKCAHRSKRTVEIKWLIESPSPHDKWKNRIGTVANYYNIEGVTLPVACCIHRAAWQRLQPRAKACQINLFHGARRVYGVKIDFLHGVGRAVERQQEAEVELLASS